jgi:hypothetical protein
MLGAFVLGGAVQQTGLASRLTQLVVARAQRVLAVNNNVNSAFFPYTFDIWSSCSGNPGLPQHYQCHKRSPNYPCYGLADGDCD